MTSIHFAFTGFGNIAKTHMTALRAMPIIKPLPLLPVLDTLVTRQPERYRAQAEAIGFRRVTDSAAEAAADEQVHVLDICTPNSRHFEDVTAALDHGKAIYCEKPVTDSYERTAQLLAETKRHPGLQEQLAFTFRYHPAVMRIRAILAEGIVGDILQCSISYRRSGYLDPQRPMSWRLQGGLSGGGATSDLAVHALDMIRHWFGDYKEISGHARAHVRTRPESAGSETRVPSEVDDWAMMNYSTESGISGTVEVSRIALGSEAFEIRIVGTHGSITADLERDQSPTVHLVRGSTPVLPVPATLDLLPGDKATMGIAVDTHFAALHHYIQRYAGEDRYPGLAPRLADGGHVEYWIDRVLRNSGQAADGEAEQ
ncbi:Gfo/Idh/MocA family protein [Paenibacillus sp. 1P07SE]|uniref:Gfo/Idh/MocA family protein n=1 Tax=Paenibacillus sp. 1P07SE TaxID=3132209 RepID=UPI0039A5DAD7